MAHRVATDLLCITHAVSGTRMGSGVPVLLRPGFVCLFLWCGCDEGLLNILKLKMFELLEKNNEIFLSGSYPTNAASSVRWTASELSACLCRRCERV